MIWEGPPVLHLTSRALWATAYLGIVASGLAFMGYYHLLSRISALTMSLIAFVTPIVALVLGALFDYEVLGPRAKLGIALVLLGVFMAARSRRASAARRR
jgi:drug/metabolite transporter (DMT)-like permease